MVTTQHFSHMVYFTLKDNSASAQQALVQACQEYLSDHEGTVYFSAGVRAQADRPVNDQEFDVALNLVFESREAHDRYQDAPRHHEFIEKNKEGWAKVRVFDADISG